MQAEYWIFAVQYYPNGPIAQVKAVPVLYNQGRNAEGNLVLGDIEHLTRETIAHWVATGSAVLYTAVVKSGVPGVSYYVLTRGARVELAGPGGDFITTEADGSRWNNFANLPRF